MNPCPCGFFGDPTRECHCSPVQIQRYVSKISGPLLDRIDIHIEVPAVKYKELRGNAEVECSGAVRERVLRARQVQLDRYRADCMRIRRCPHACSGSTVRSRRTAKSYSKRRSSGSAFQRAHDRILKVSRTIADLEGAECIQPKHLSEAIQYRTLDRTYWA